MANLEEEEKYGASSIQVLEGLEPVRKRCIRLMRII